MKNRVPLWAPAVLVAVWVGACDDTPVDNTIAKAVSAENEMEVAQKKLAELHAKEVAEKKAAQEAKQEAIHDEIDAATRLPEEMPKTVKEACDALVKSYDDFRKNGGPDDNVYEWWEGHGQKLAIRREKCETANSIPAAACGAVALREPLESLQEMDRVEAGRMILAKCAEKHGKS